MRIDRRPRPIANRIGRQGLAGQTLGHQALADVIKIVLQRTNQRIGGPDALRLILLARAFASHRPNGARPPRRRLAGWRYLPAHARPAGVPLRSRHRLAACAAWRAMPVRGTLLLFQWPRAFCLGRQGRSCRLSRSQRLGNAPSLATTSRAAPERPVVSQFSTASPCQSEDRSKRWRRLVFQSKRIEIELKPRQGRKTGEHDENGDRDNPYSVPLQEASAGAKAGNVSGFGSGGGLKTRIRAGSSVRLNT